MLLVIDVGNTNFVLGLYKKEKLVKCWRMTTGGNRTADETGIFIHGLFDAAGIDAGKVEAVIISSVVAVNDSSFREMSVFVRFLEIGIGRADLL